MRRSPDPRGNPAVPLQETLRAQKDTIEETATDVGLPREQADEVIRQWGELALWPEAHRAARALIKRVPVGVSTHSSLALAKIAVASLCVQIPSVVTAEEAGCCKYHSRPYRMAPQRFGCEAGMFSPSPTLPDRTLS